MHFLRVNERVNELLESNSDCRIIPGLERITGLLEKMGRPQDSFRSIHVVGTNGKGSTGAFISSVLSESGYKTGFYSSPHLVRLSERLLVDGRELSEDAWLEAVKLAVETGVKSSYFELLTASAFELARRLGIEVGVIEAGLGGKLDATNTMSNTVCTVIASISIDHTEYLGPTLESIASEKFAVVREGVPAVFSGVDETLVPLFLDTCRARGAMPFIVTKQTRTENVKLTPEGNEFDFYSPRLSLKNLHTTLIGSYQVKNAALALSAISLIREAFPKITENSIRAGMLKAKWPGRLEIVSREPLVILDGGHNLDGVRNLCDSVKNLWPERKFGIVYAAMRDKDYASCLKLLSELKSRLYLTCVPGMARSARPEELQKSAKGFDVAGRFEDPEEAIKRALAENENVIICGSLYFIGWVKGSRVKI